ncbi:MAG: biopolymer transporter ExbD [Bacteroidales bacterium]
MARKKRKVPQVNSSSSADIAFLLLIFFLITTSMDTDKGLLRRLPPPIPPDQEQKDQDVKMRNVLQVLINSNNQLLVGGEPMSVDELRAKAKEFIANKEDLPNLPERFPTEVEFFGSYPVTKFHVISLQNDRSTEYQAYIEVQNELVAAYNELRNELAKAKFNKPFEELGEEEQKAIQKIYPQKISEAEPKNYGGKK